MVLISLDLINFPHVSLYGDNGVIHLGFVTLSPNAGEPPHLGARGRSAA